MKYTLFFIVLFSMLGFAFNRLNQVQNPSPIYKVGDCIRGLTYKRETWESKYSSYPRRILEVGKYKYRYEFFTGSEWLTTADTSINFNVAQFNSEKVECPK